MGLLDRWRVWRRLAGCAPLDDASAEGSLVHATGTVRSLGESLIAPLSGRTCVAYRIRVQARGTINAANATAQGGRSMHELVQLCAFALEVGAERIVITGAHAEFSVPRSRPPRNNAAREAHVLLLTASRSQHGWFREAMVCAGDRITVGGSLALDPPDEPPSGRELDYRAPPPLVRRISGSHAAPLAIRLAGPIAQRALPSQG